MRMPTAPASPRGFRTLSLLTPYQWFVFAVCCLAWDMDCMDQQLFVVARAPAMASLVPKVAPDDARLPEFAAKLREKATADGKPAPANGEVLRQLQDSDAASAGGLATSVFMVGWAIGGVVFGVMGDRVGRVRTLTVTILLYAVFTGLSAFSLSTADFALYRFLTGLGVGGVFAAAVTLLAETMPDAARPYVLGLFQASSVVGNCAAALLSMLFGELDYRRQLEGLALAGQPLEGWRLMFLVGILPALLVVVIQVRLREPEKWRLAKAAGPRANPYAELFASPQLVRHLGFGLMLAISGVVGLWGIGFFAPELVRSILRPGIVESAAALGLSGDDAARLVKRDLTTQVGITSLVQNAGSFLGIFSFALVTARLGRRPAFALFFVLAGTVTALVFRYLETPNEILWMIPAMGFFQLALFGGYAIYLPELFPTRLRSTGTSFCYNIGRLVAAVGPAALGFLTSSVYAHLPAPMPVRYAGMTLCAVFALGLVALPFLPETRGKPLPD